MLTGTVTDIENGKAYVQFASEAAPRHLAFRAPKGQAIVVGDMVVCAQIGGAWIILQIYSKE